MSCFYIITHQFQFISTSILSEFYTQILTQRGYLTGYMRAWEKIIFVTGLLQSDAFSLCQF